MRTAIRLLAAAVGIAAAAASHAQAPGPIPLQTLEPAPAGDPLFTVATPHAPGHRALAVGLTTSYARDPLVLQRDGHEIPGGQLVRDQLWTVAQASLGLGSWARLHLAIPLALHQAGDQSFASVPRVAAAPGDLRVGGQASLGGVGRVDLAAGLDVWLPTGGRAGYTTDGGVRALPRLIAGGEVGRLAYGAQVGILLAKTLDVGYASTGSGLAYAAGLAWRQGAFRVGPEAWGQVGFAGTRSPAEVLLGGHWSPAHYDLGLAVATTMRRDPGGAPLRVVLTVAWRQAAESVRTASESAAVPPAPRAERVADERAADERAMDELALAERLAAKAAVERAEAERLEAERLTVDHDRDGIPDSKDPGPDQQGVAGADAVRNGGPAPALAVVTKERIEILQAIQFETDQDAILPESDPILRDVASVLVSHPEIAKVRVEGHTDSHGPVDRNTRLSERRARAVVQWLIANGGVGASRLEARGYGPTRPIGPNDTKEGRARNRRVEFLIDHE